MNLADFRWGDISNSVDHLVAQSHLNLSVRFDEHASSLRRVVDRNSRHASGVHPLGCLQTCRISVAPTRMELYVRQLGFDHDEHMAWEVVPLGKDCH